MKGPKRLLTLALLLALAQIVSGCAMFNQFMKGRLTTPASSLPHGVASLSTTAL